MDSGAARAMAARGARFRMGVAAGFAAALGWSVAVPAIGGTRWRPPSPVAPERASCPGRRRRCRDLHLLTVVNTIGNRVIVAAARNAGSCDYQFGPPPAAAN